MPEHAASAESSRYLTPDPALAAGTTHHGFTVVSAEPISELSGCAYVFRHEATGARLMWLACEDTNKAFALAFKTPPADSTGVFHILEHSVLDGSDKFPVKEPFVNLLKTSMQTFLNAMTFPDKTVYPVSSTNEKDLENLMDVYLDAVLHPAIYHRPHIFEQEGWHYELESKDAPLTYNGVVLNEMKGALSDPDEVLYHAMQESLFPDTPYAFEWGGDPRDIVKLTYEQFLDTHARHYQLSNSYTILYGAIDLERELAFIDERFQGADDRGAGAPNPLPLQKPVKLMEPRKVEMATAEENASCALGYVIGTAQDRERVLAVDVLLDALAGSNEAPLKRAVMDAGLADDFTVTLLDGLQQPLAFMELKGIREGAAEKFRPFVEDYCRKLVSDGIGHDKLAASLSQAEFNLREGDWGYSDGVALSIQALSSWLYDDERPVDYLRYEDALAHMREWLDQGYFEKLLDELICTSAHTAAVELVPVEEGSHAEEEAELAERKAQMDEDALQQVMDEVKALRQEQEAPDAPEDIAKLPSLHVSDIDEGTTDPEVLEPSYLLTTWHHPLDTHHIDYVYYYFDLKRIGYEELPYVAVLADLLGNLTTQHHSASELDTLVETKLGSFNVFVEAYGTPDDLSYVSPKLVVGASALSENVASLAQIPAEIWDETLFSDDTDRIYQILQQRRVAMEQDFMNNGHTLAMSRATSQLLPLSRLIDKLSGIDFYFFLKKLLDRWQYRKQPTVEVLYNLASRIFTADDVVVSFTGPDEDLKRFWDAAGDLKLQKKGGQVTAENLKTPEMQPVDEAFIVPSNVVYVGESSLPCPADAQSLGTWQVGMRPISFGYLWNEVRVKGGAYGCGIRHQANGMTQSYSYRDPSIDSTIERFGHEGDWLKTWEPTPDELDGYLVSTVASVDAPRKPRVWARLQDSIRFQKRPASWKADLRQEMLDTTADDIRSLASTLAWNAEHHVTCVFGSADIIKSAKHPFKTVQLISKEA